MESSGEQGSVICGTFIRHQEARTGNQLLMEDSREICSEFPKSSGKGILQREGVMVPGYAAPGGGKTLGQCVRDQKVVARGSEFFSSSK